MVLPVYQCKGYGKFLIKFAYEISKLEKKMGTPERPLSDLARRVYISWWRNQIIKYMIINKDKAYTINDIANETYIIPRDIIFTLDESKMIKFCDGKYNLLTDEEFLKRRYRKELIDVNPDKISWVVYIKKR